jgi:hypothetical protein
MTSRGMDAFKNGHFDAGMPVLQQGMEQLLARKLPEVIWQAAGDGIWLMAKALSRVMVNAQLFSS